MCCWNILFSLMNVYRMAIELYIIVSCMECLFHCHFVICIIIYYFVYVIAAAVYVCFLECLFIIIYATVSGDGTFVMDYNQWTAGLDTFDLKQFLCLCLYNHITNQFQAY